jgi:hypothetical protein
MIQILCEFVNRFEPEYLVLVDGFGSKKAPFYLIIKRGFHVSGWSDDNGESLKAFGFPEPEDHAPGIQ